MKQFHKSVTKYKTELRELAEFVLELANFEEYLCSKFQEGLSLEIREKMSITKSQTYKEVVQLALRAEKLIGERISQSNFQKRKGFDFFPNNHIRKVEILTLREIFQVRDLDLSVLLNPPNPLNL